MIVYNPIDGDALTSGIVSLPRTCFLMTQLGEPVPDEALEIRTALLKVLTGHGIESIDATSQITGRDFLLKIWRMIASVPLAIGIVHGEMPETTQSNIFYELGIAQAMGKETVIIKAPKTKVPSDFVRTEYIGFNDKFEVNFSKYLKSFFEQAEHYETVADQLEKNPLLAMDYLRRAFLISGNESLREKARNEFSSAGIQERAKNSVETLLADF